MVQPSIAIFQPGQEEMDGELYRLMRKYADEAGVIIDGGVDSFKDREEREGQSRSNYQTETDTSELFTTVVESPKWNSDPFQGEDQGAAYHWLVAIFVSLTSAGSLSVIARAIVELGQNSQIRRAHRISAT